MKIIKNKHILYLFLLSSVLLMLDIFLYWNYKISFAGFYTDCVVFWVWIFSFLGVIIAYWKKLVAKISLGIFVLAIVLSFVPMGLPIIIIIHETTGLGLYFDKKLNNKYRVQCSGFDLMDYPPIVIKENKYFLFERDLEYEIYEFPKHYYKDIELVGEDKDSLHLKIKNEDTSEIVKISKN